MISTMRTDEQVIDALGGTSAVAVICEVSQPAVSQWKVQGIPRARRMYLELLRPDVFKQSATASDA